MAVREPMEYSQDSFNNLYSVAVLEKLISEKLIGVINYLKLGDKAVDLMTNLSKRYPLPSYDILSSIIFDIITGINPHSNIKKADIKKLCMQIEANNGYVL